MVPTGHTSPDRWLHDFVSDGQILAGQVGEVPLSTLIDRIWTLVAAIPPALSLPNRFIARDLMARVLARIAAVMHIDSHPAVEHAFLAFAASNVQGECWHAELCQLAERCVAALRGQAPGDQLGRRPVTDRRIARILRAIDDQHRDPDLMLGDLAKKANMSSWYLARVLKRETGASFVAHIRRCRVTDVEHLLTDSVLTVKEIAAVVGYRNPRQLERDFKRMRGLTPIVFRRIALAGVPSDGSSVHQRQLSIYGSARKDHR